MWITLLTESQVRECLDQVLGGKPTASDVAADLLRQEVTARRRSPRHFLIGRVCRLAAPAMALASELVSDVCEDLERQGDIVLADGGLIYPAPARIIALGGGIYRVVCAVPSARLFATVDGEWTRRGVRRECRFRRPAEHVAETLGGIVVTPEAWAGFDRVPAADGDWLRSLNARLAWAPEPAGSLEHEEPLEWSGFALEQDELRWRASRPTQLWRARHRWKRWVYAWTAGESPSVQSFVTLYPDEGSRTVYAVARAAEKPFRGSISKSDEDMIVRITGWLPQAEYRYLSTCAEPAETSGGGSTWVISAARAEGVVNTLAARLSVLFEQSQAT